MPDSDENSSFLTVDRYKFKSSKTQKQSELLETIFENQPVSKWDLAKTDKKPGLTNHSWVLIHKLMQGLENSKLIESKEKRKVTKEDKKQGKKHSTSLYKLTDYGITLLFTLNRKVFEKYKKEHWSFDLDLPPGKNSMPNDPIVQIMDYVWRVGFGKGHNSQLRNKIILEMINKNKKENATDILIKIIVNQIFVDSVATIFQLNSAKEVTLETIENMYAMQTARSNILFSFSAKLSRFNEEVNKTFVSEFKSKLLLMDIEMDIMKDTFFKSSLEFWPEDESVNELKSKIVSFYTDMTQHSDLREAANIMKEVDFDGFRESLGINIEKRNKENRERQKDNCEVFLPYVKRAAKGEFIDDLARIVSPTTKYWLTFLDGPPATVIGKEGMDRLQQGLSEIKGEFKFKIVEGKDDAEIRVKITDKNAIWYGSIQASSLETDLIDNIFVTLDIKRDIAEENRIQKIKPKTANPLAAEIIERLKKIYAEKMNERYRNYEI